MKKLIYAIGVSLFLAFMAFHVTVSLTNPYWGVSVEALAQGSGSGGTGVGESCTSDENCGYYGYKKGEDGEYNHWYWNTGTDIQGGNKCCSALAIDDEGNSNEEPPL